MWQLSDGFDVDSQDSLNTVSATSEPIDVLTIRPLKLCIGKGGGDFACESLLFDGFAMEFGQDIAAGYLNGDDILDFVHVADSEFSNEINTVCLGTENAEFNCEQIDSKSLEYDGSSVALGDVDNDGDLDVVLTYDGSNIPLIAPAQVCLGDGEGQFTCDPIGQDTLSGDVALGDINNDGNLDAVFAGVLNASIANTLCLGNGKGTFSCQPANDSNFTGIQVALGDMNNDGNLDAVFARATYSYAVCFGNGLGEFSCVSGASGITSQAVALGDMNEDNHLDVILSSQITNGDRICLGDGDGALTCTNGDPRWTNEYIHLADVNADNHLDIISRQIYLGDGTGSVKESDYFFLANAGVAFGHIASITSNEEVFLYLPVIFK